MGTFSSWSPYERYVQGQGMDDGRYVAGYLTLIAAGPPRLAHIGGRSQVAGTLDAGSADIVFPIGATQNLNHSQNKTFMRVWELGSERSYFIGGRTVGNLALARVMYHGPSLLRVLYAYYQDLAPPITVPWLFGNTSVDLANPHDVIVPPGYENMFLNLASDLFNQPIGLMIYMRDTRLENMGAIYLEHVIVPNHTWATDAQGTIVQETVALQYERVVPVNIQAVPLVTGLSEAGPVLE